MELSWLIALHSTLKLTTLATLVFFLLETAIAPVKQTQPGPESNLTVSRLDLVESTPILISSYIVVIIIILMLTVIACLQAMVLEERV